MVFGVWCPDSDVQSVVVVLSDQMKLTLVLSVSISFLLFFMCWMLMLVL